MHSDIKRYFNRLINHHDDNLRRLEAQHNHDVVYNSQVNWNSDVCLSVEHTDEPVPIVLIRNSRQIYPRS